MPPEPVIIFLLIVMLLGAAACVLGAGADDEWAITSGPHLSKFDVRVLTIIGKDEIAMVSVANRVGGLFRSKVYAALATLQRDGYVAARWEGAGGPRPQRYVHLTDKGLAAIVSANRAAA